MQKKIRKIPLDHTFLGYSLINYKKQVCKVVGEDKALLVLDKVNSFDDTKDYDVVEVSFEQVILIMSKFGSSYAFNEKVLHKFLDLIENLNLGEEIKDELNKLRDWKPKNEKDCVSVSLSS